MGNEAESPYPWRDGRPLLRVVEGGRRWLERKRLVRKGPGCGEAAVDALANRLKGDLPRDVRALLLAVEPIPMFRRGKIVKGGPGEFFFYGPESPELRWHSLVEWTPAEDWAGARGLAIGQTGYGDVILWVAGHRVHADGCIAVHDHEVAMGDLPYAVWARSLAEFVAKVVYLKGLQPGLDDLFDDDLEEDDDAVWEDLEGDEDDPLGMAGVSLFNQEYGELNPTSQRGKATVEAADNGYSIRPDDEDVELHSAAEEDLPDLGPLERLKYLTVRTGEHRFDVDRRKYVVECGPSVDLARLLPNATLERLACQWSHVRGLEALAGCVSLRQLRLEECRVEVGRAAIALPRLEEFEAEGSTLADVSFLAGAPRLNELYIPGTRVRDLSPVAGLTAIETVNICDTPVKDLGPLLKLARLRSLEVTEGQFSARVLKAFRAARPEVTIELRPPNPVLPVFI